MNALLRIGQSLRLKTTGIVLLITAAALIVNAAALLAYEYRSYRDSQFEDVRTQAQIVGYAAAAALSFRDRGDAAAALAALGSRPDILAGALYTEDGALFTAYPPHAASPAPPRAAPPGERLEGDILHVWTDIEIRGEKVGSVYLSGRGHLDQKIRAYAGIIAGALLAALAVAGLLSSILQRLLTRPILAIESAAREVIRKSDYSIRAPRLTRDEIGVLADGFNRMLAEIERREGQLRLADRRKDEFLATLAHELRNPLAPIRNALEVMRIRPSDAAVAESMRTIMSRQVHQMVRLVDDLLDISRINTGKLVLRRERVRVLPIARSALESVEPLFAARNQTLDFRPPSDEIHLSADSTRLAQVFTNLLSNASKFSADGGAVTFAISFDGQDLVASVKDAGIGIAPEHRESIFEMFSQVDQSLERASGGLGVGLALSRTLVELHGGALSLHSDGPGKGSEFTVRIPGATQDRSVPVRMSATAGQRQAKRFLVIDDNRDFASSLAMLLQEKGNEVKVVADGRSGIVAATEFRPDIVVLDIGMPGMNGFQVAEELCGPAGWRPRVLIAVTGFSQPSDRRRALEAGFDHYFVKPVDIADLVRAARGEQAS